MNNSTRTIFEWALATSLLLSLVFLMQFYFRSHQARAFQAQLIQYQQRHVVVNQLVNDTLDYSRHDASIVPVLQSMHNPGIDQFLQANGIRPPATTASKPAGK